MSKFKLQTNFELLGGTGNCYLLFSLRKFSALPAFVPKNALCLKADGQIRLDSFIRFYLTNRVKLLMYARFVLFRRVAVRQEGKHKICQGIIYNLAQVVLLILAHFVSGNEE